MRGSDAASSVSPAVSCSPRARTFSRKPGSVSTSIEASAAAQPIGLPPYVPPWLPLGQRAMSSARAPSAENGKPDAMPLAMHNTSGSMPACVTANISPVRPNPDCTSSATNRMPCCAHRAASPCRNRAGAGT